MSSRQLLANVAIIASVQAKRGRLNLNKVTNRDGASNRFACWTSRCIRRLEISALENMPLSLFFSLSLSICKCISGRHAASRRIDRYPDLTFEINFSRCYRALFDILFCDIQFFPNYSNPHIYARAASFKSFA